MSREPQIPTWYRSIPWCLTALVLAAFAGGMLTIMQSFLVTAALAMIQIGIFNLFPARSD